MSDLPLRVPRATYRVQLNGSFTFGDLKNILPYLRDLGISEVYASPFYQAVPGSTHGYDVSDQNEVNTELGGREGLEALSTSLKEKDLGLITDFVPNHMGIVGPLNWKWLDVLENGADSLYAKYFDIEWRPRLRSLHRKVMVPMLGDHYGKVLEAGQLQLRHEDGRLWIYAPGSRFPLRPGSYRPIIRRLAESLSTGSDLRAEALSLVEQLERFDTGEGSLEERQSNAVILKECLITLFNKAKGKSLLDAILVSYNGNVGDSKSFDDLHDLLEQQHYRLTFWKAGAHEVNYRRFFAVDTLIGLRMEDPAVFQETHQLLAELIANRVVTGVRLDHIDGLWNPEEYLFRLAKLWPDGKPVYTLVEKILAPHENLPPSWPVHGTSGYEFAGNLIELFLRPEDEEKWTKIYQDFTGIARNPVELTYAAKCFVLSEIFPNAISNLALELDQLVEGDRRWRDLTVHDLEVALAGIIACLPVYRTYKMAQQYIANNEAQYIEKALRLALEENRFLDPVPFRFVADVMQGAYPPACVDEEKRAGFDRWICKFEQATGAVMAKSVEDTLFYRYTRMFATNEVGHHPSRFGAPRNSFHHACWHRLKKLPLCMLTTSTHDTKMSEDVRARLFALAENPQEWCSHLQEWHARNDVCKTSIAGIRAPDCNEEYLLYQILLGSWPLGAEMADDEYLRRIKVYFRKAVEEAKVNTNWIHPNGVWLEACDRFIDGILGGGVPTPFLAGFLPLASKIAERGMVFSLAQTVLKFTVPGVPDIYQGNEIWDFSLVDPDNRRPVDYGHRIKLLQALPERSPDDLLKNWRDGGIKLAVTRALLGNRAQYPRLYSEGEYLEVGVRGQKQEQILSFRRVLGDQELMVVVPINHYGSLPSDEVGWGNTAIEIAGRGAWTHIFLGTDLTPETDSLPVGEILGRWPVAVLMRNKPTIERTT